MTKWEPVPIHERWASDDAAGLIPRSFSSHDESEIFRWLSGIAPDDEIEALVHFAKENGTMKEVHDWLEGHGWDWPADDLKFFESLNRVVSGEG